MAEGESFMTEGQTEAHQWLDNFWTKTMDQIKATTSVRLIFNRSIICIM